MHGWVSWLTKFHLNNEEHCLQYLLAEYATFIGGGYRFSIIAKVISVLQDCYACMHAVHSNATCAACFRC